MNKTKIFLASKRAPITYKIDEKTKRNVPWLAPGGTANVVADMACYLEINWVASAMTEEDRVVAKNNPNGFNIKFTSEQPIHLYLLQHDREVFDDMQYIFTSNLMWASNNYLWDSWAQPTFDEKIKIVWKNFMQFTKDFAEAILVHSENEKDPLYLIHDYQLVCVPQLIRKVRPHSPMLLFVHIPWPSADYWRMMPKYVRINIIKGMLGASTIAFFANRWVINFLACVNDLIPEAKVDFNLKIINYDERIIHVESMPLGYSPQAVEFRSPLLDKELENWIGNKLLILHSGRTDPMKNAVRAIESFVLAVQKDSVLQNACLLVRTNPNRLYVKANKTYFEQIKLAVEKANKALNNELVRMVFENNVDATFGCMQRADIFIYNSTIDGQNLTVFESALVNKRNAPIILSERCGAAEVLQDVCIMINPFDIAEQADAILMAAKLSKEDRAKEAKKRIAVVKKYDLPSWVEMQMKSLGIKDIGIT